MKQLEYVQQIEHLKIDLKDLENILENRPIYKWCYTIHDKDVLENGQPKPTHIHVAMKFHSDQTIENVSKWFDDEVQYFQKAKNQSRYAFEYMAAYQSHNPKVFPKFEGVKYYYPTEEIHSNFDYDEMIDKLLNGFKKKEEQNTKNISDEVLRKITNNEIPRIKLTEYLDNVTIVRNKTLIDNAYKLRDEIIAKEINREMDVMYIEGKSGSGKTTIAKYFAESRGYSVFISGSSNDPLEGYIGQECVILDDLRSSDWKMSDLLKFLDNNTTSRVKSRYNNKLMNDCKLIIITSVISIEDMYKGLQEREQEPIQQLFRRIKTNVVLDENLMHLYEYSQINNRYEFTGVSANPLPKLLIKFREQKGLSTAFMNLINDLESGKIG